MARPLSRDIWHLSIDDFLAPLPESARLGGPGPFVINLSASTAPISQPIKSVIGCPDAHVYQIQRTEDRRLRYRLRLGLFATEDEAYAVLEKVRDIYPGALTATAVAEDLRVLEAIQAKVTAKTKATSQPKVDVQPKGSAPTAIDVKQPPLDSIPVLSEAVSLDRPASVPPPVSREMPPLEPEDLGASRWFVIQLSIADQTFDPDSLPNLDIFSVYRLYSVAGLDQGRIKHALRLGFFSDEIAAGAVASYLTAFYQSSIVKRVSAAERDRFADQCFEARKDVGATGQHAAIEITGDRVVRESRIATAATPQKSVDRPSASRLVAQKSRRF